MDCNKIALILAHILMITLMCQYGSTSEDADLDMVEDVVKDGRILTCDDCGTRCKLLCGSRRFRLCCVQFVRKRSAWAPAIDDEFVYMPNSIPLKDRLRRSNYYNRRHREDEDGSSSFISGRDSSCSTRMSDTEGDAC